MATPTAATSEATVAPDARTAHAPSRLAWGFERPVHRDWLATVAWLVVAFDLGRGWDVLVATDWGAAGPLGSAGLVVGSAVVRGCWVFLGVGVVAGSVRAFLKALLRR